MYKNKCAKIKRGDFYSHKKLKKVAETRLTKLNQIEDKNRKKLIDLQEKLKRSKKQKPNALMRTKDYNQNRTSKTNFSITKKKVDKAIRLAKTGKTTG